MILKKIAKYLSSYKFFNSFIPSKHRTLIKKVYSIIKKKATKKDFFFIQIGSNDGISGDPIYPFIVRYKWKGILLEPLKETYDKLLMTYKGNINLKFYNSAISDSKGEKDFFKLRKDKNLPKWADKMGSFSKEVILSSEKYIPEIEKYIIVDKVKCMSFGDLISENSVKNIDLLHTDVEGFDYQILKQIDFSKVNINMILFEYHLLSEADKKECFEFLSKLGYNVVVSGSDAFAYR